MQSERVWHVAKTSKHLQSSGGVPATVTERDFVTVSSARSATRPNLSSLQRRWLPRANTSFAGILAALTCSLRCHAKNPQDSLECGFIKLRVHEASSAFGGEWVPVESPARGCDEACGLRLVRAEQVTPYPDQEAHGSNMSAKEHDVVAALFLDALGAKHSVAPRLVEAFPVEYDREEKRREEEEDEEGCREERNMQQQRTQQPIFHAGARVLQKV